MAILLLELVLLLVSGATTRNTGQWTIHDERRDGRVLSLVANVLPEAQGEVEGALGLKIGGRGTILLCASMESFRRATPGFDHRHTLGVAMPQRRVIVLNCEAIEQALFEKITLTLRHELSHIVVGEVAHRTSRRVPLWFDEGVAVWVAGKIPRYDVTTFQLRATAGTLLPLESLSTSFPRDPVERGIAYEQSESFVRYVVARHGADTIRRTLRTAADGAPFEQAFESATGAALAQTEAAWRDWLRPRWPLLSWIANAFSIFTGISLLALVSIWVYLRRRRRKYREWEMEEGL